MITEEQKQQLINKLQEERNRFFLNNISTLDHDFAIEYLKTGKTNGEHGEHELLEACIDDLDCLYNDYCN